MTDKVWMLRTESFYKCYGETLDEVYDWFLANRINPLEQLAHADFIATESDNKLTPLPPGEGEYWRITGGNPNKGTRYHATKKDRP